MLSFKKIFKVLISFLILFNFSNLLSNELSEISKLRVINTSEGSRIIIESEKSNKTPKKRKTSKKTLLKKKKTKKS